MEKESCETKKKEDVAVDIAEAADDWCINSEP